MIFVETTMLAAPELHCVADLSLLTSGADAVILSTDWPEYQSIDWTQVCRSMRGDFIFDTRNALDAAAVTDAGLRYASYGRRPA